MPVRKGYLCLRRGLEPPLDLSPLALRLRDLRLQRGALRRHGVFGARTRALQLRRLKPSGHRGQRTDQWMKVGARKTTDTTSWSRTERPLSRAIVMELVKRQIQVEGVWVTISLCCMRSSATSFCAIVSSCAFRSSSVCRDTQPTTQHDILSRQHLNVLTPDSRSHLEQTTSNSIVLES